MDSVEKVLKRYEEVVVDGFLIDGPGARYRSYAISNLRGGVGKSTLAFNLAYEMSRNHSVLVADLCPQCNLTETMMRHEERLVTVYDALLPQVMGPSFGSQVDDISYRVSDLNKYFKRNKKTYFVPGSQELFTFASLLYQQLQAALSGKRSDAILNLLHALKTVLNKEAKEKACEKILMDTSPFYAGGTHLAWCAADAVIIPVRVDEHSIDSLEMTFKLLASNDKDFKTWIERAGGFETPKVAAVVMTMAGSKSQHTARPDRASVMYIERALKLAENYSELFEFDDLADAFVITDDFVSSGRISGARSIPLSCLQPQSFHAVERRRLQVNQSVTRYQKEVHYLASVI